jgi:hypothetical protein
MLTAGLRAADVQEVKASHGLSPEAALWTSFKSFSKSWVLLTKRGYPCAMWGVAPWPLVPELGAPWLLATEEFNHQSKELLRHSPLYVTEMGKGFRYLANYVDVRHIESIRWLHWAGFRFDRLLPEFGYERRPFLLFTKEPA